MTLQPDAHFGRILAAYGGVFVAGSLAWGMAVDGFVPDRWDVTGALVCLAGVAIIIYAPAPGLRPAARRRGCLRPTIPRRPPSPHQSRPAGKS